jgi:hypothetical protein
MNVIIPPAGHCPQRMAERGVTRADVEHALQTCVQHSPGRDGGTCHVGYGADGKRLLKVWTLPPAMSHAGGIRIKSVAWKDI